MLFEQYMRGMRKENESDNIVQTLYIYTYVMERGKIVQGSASKL